MCDMKCLVAANGKPAPFWTEEEQKVGIDRRWGEGIGREIGGETVAGM